MDAKGLMELSARATQGEWSFTKSPCMLAQWGVGQDLYVGTVHIGDQAIAIVAHDGLSINEGLANAKLSAGLVNYFRSAEYAEIVRDAERWRSMLAMIGDEDLRVQCKVFECRPGSPLSDRASYASIDADELKDAIDSIAKEPK